MRSWIALAATLALAGCTEEVTYSYFDVTVAVDPATVDMEKLNQIQYCGLFVTGATTAQTNLPCARNSVPYSYGKVGWSTKLTQGQVVFSVEMQDFNHVLIAKGTSGPVTIAPDVITPVSVLVKLAGTPGPDGGAPDGGRLDAGATDASTTDARPADAHDGSADAPTD